MLERRSPSVGSLIRPRIVILVLGLIYAGVRIAACPSNGETLTGFCHDSGYFCIVARNLAAGRGLVNDASWLVFLAPSNLPMPFHNANPLLAYLLALLQLVAGISPSNGVYYVNAVANATLFVLAAEIGLRLRRSLFAAILCGVVTAGFPIILLTSYAHSADALADSLWFGAMIMLVLGQDRRYAFGSGILYGLSWLARSQIVLALPAILLYFGLRRTASAGDSPTRWHRVSAATLFLGGALVTVAPWLVHNFRVWGNPLRSDSSTYLFQDLAATEMAPAAGSAGLAVEQFWHSPEQPPAPLRIIANAPGAFAGHIVKGSIANARTAISVWSRGQLWCAALLVGGILLFVPYLWKLDRGLVCAGLTYIATTWLVLSIRWQTVETRYFNTICLMVVLAAFTGYAGLIDGLKTPFPRRWLNIAALSCGMIYGVVIIPYQSWLVVTKMTSVSEELVGYREFCQRVDQEYTRGSAVVVGSKPYLYSWYTSAPSLAIPAQVHTDPNAAALRRYMEKYHARFVLLTHEELKFWRPQWSQDGFPEDLEVLMQDSHGILFARKVAP